MEVGAEAAAAWPLPNRSLADWVGPVLDEVGELTEKAFQSPNSPFPLDEATAVGETVVHASGRAKSQKIAMAFKLLWKGEGVLTGGSGEAGGGGGRREVGEATNEI